MADLTVVERLRVRFIRRPVPDRWNSSVPGITVLSYNVGKGLALPDRLVDFLLGVEADIIELQELAPSRARAIEKNLVTKYPHQALVPTGFSGKGLLSRFPIHESSSVDLVPERPDLNASVEILGHRVRVFVAHPRQRRARLSGTVFDPVTQNQIQCVAEPALSQGPSIVLGDFNLTDRQPEHKFLTSTELIDEFHKAGERAASFPKRPLLSRRFGPRSRNLPLSPLIRIVSIWFIAEFTAVSVGIGDDAGSDHPRCSPRSTGGPSKTRSNSQPEQSTSDHRPARGAGLFWGREHVRSRRACAKPAEHHGGQP